MNKESIFSICWKTFKEMLKAFGNGIRKELSKIATIIQVAVPTVLATLKVSALEMLVIICITLVVVEYIRNVSSKLNRTTRSGFPIPTKTYTEIDENGFISLKNADEAPEAILYLNSIEQYIKGKGLL